MLPWRAPRYLTRVWCVFEFFTALTSADVRLAIATPPAEADAFSAALFGTADGLDEFWDAVAAVDVERAEASVAEDQQRILGIIARGSSPSVADYR